MRLGAFHQVLTEWAERPCVLTVAIPAIGSTLRISGILRPYFSKASMHGWALVPPQQHGGFDTMRLTELSFAEMTRRSVIAAGAGKRLRFSRADGTVFELERDTGALLTAPPRTVRSSRYLYRGGRRRRLPEAWMLQ